MAFSLIFWASLVVAASAAKPQPPAGLVKARRAFAAAVAAKDEAATARLTNFPLKTIVYKEPPTLDRAAFARRFAEYKEMAACIETAPLEPRGKGWEINCNGNILGFEARAGRWLHTVYENINE